MTNNAHSKASSWILRYGAALIAVALATALRLLIDPVLGSRLPFTTYFVAAILVAVYRGLGPALLTVALGAVLGRTCSSVMDLHSLTYLIVFRLPLSVSSPQAFRLS